MDRFSLAAAVVFIVISQLKLHDAKPSTVWTGKTATMPKQCANKTFCTTRSHDYPEKLIDALLNGTEQLFKEYSESIGDRYGPDTKSQPSDECKSTTHVKPIYEIVDMQGKTRFVVQSKKFKQIIRIEECDYPGPVTNPTAHLHAQHVKNNRLTCHQCKLNYKFVVLSLNGTSLEAVRVKGGLPVCCSCQRLQENKL